MSESFDDPEFRRAIQQARRRLDTISDAEFRLLLQQKINEALADEMAEARQTNQREAEALRAVLTRDSRQEEIANARGTLPSTILLLIMLLLILLLIAAALGRTDILGLPGMRAEPTPLAPRLSDQAVNPQLAIASDQLRNPGNVAALNSLNSPAPVVGASFAQYYAEHDGPRVFGLPISQQLTVNGRTIQWFERTRLEEWPEHRGTPYAIQPGRVGAEFTDAINFPAQRYFVSRPGLRFFPETGHGVGEPFLSFWEAHGGLTTLGYPLSDVVQEMLPDGIVHSVQYFERGRLEYHPQQAGTAYEVQIGLLGRALYLNESEPHIIPPPRPTVVPMP